MINLYKIINTINNKAYIGQTNNISWRWKIHCKRAYGNNPTRKKSALSCAIRKYGKNKFKIEVLGFCYSRGAADIAEMSLIDYWKNRIELYNRSKGGDGYKGWKWTELAKAEFSGRKLSLSHRHNISLAQKGCKRSEECRRNISLGNFKSWKRRKHWNMWVNRDMRVYEEEA